MTPKEKAIELVDKMFNCDKSTPNESMAMLYPHAKQCALIAVDEMLKFEESIINQLDKITKGAKGEFIVQNKYWEEVKSEIEKL